MKTLYFGRKITCFVLAILEFVCFQIDDFTQHAKPPPLKSFKLKQRESFKNQIEIGTQQ